MANRVRVIWTALPNGFVADGSKLQLSLFASIQLVSDEPAGATNDTLDKYPLGNWTQRVSSFTFDIAFNGVSQAHTIKNRSDGEIRFDESMWTALFGDPKSFKVNPYKV